MDLSPAASEPELPPFIQPPKALSRSYKTFLASEGALQLPNDSLQYELLKSYIEFSYPRMPAIDLDALCDAIERGDGSGGHISLVLYQAILFAGAAHISPRIVEDNGWSSKMALRRELYRRVEVSTDSSSPR